MTPIVREPGAELERAIRRCFAGSGCLFTLEALSSRSWASATFTGTRHKMRFTLQGEGAESAAGAFLADLTEAEFSLRGHVLADIALVSEERSEGSVTISLEALTIEDG